MKTLNLALPVLLTGLVACTSIQPDSRDSQGSYDSSLSVAEASAPRADSSASAHSESRTNSASSASLAFPTGDPATSAVLLEKHAPEEVVAGQPFSYEMNVTNLTDLTLENVVVTDALAENFVMESSTPQPASFGSGAGTWTIGSLQPHETFAITVNGRSDQPGFVSSCSEVQYNTSMCLTTQVVQPALQLALDGTRQATTCDPIELVYTVSNTGSGTARDVRVQGDFPTGITGEGGARRFSETVGDLASGESREIAVAVEASNAGSFDHVGRAVASGGLSADAAPLTTVVGQPVLSITHTGPERLFVGGKTNYEIVVTNTGDAPALGTVLVDRLGQAMSFLSATAEGRHKNGDVRWELGDILPGEAKTVRVLASADEIGSARHVAATEADCAQPVRAEVNTELAGIPAILLEVVDLEDPVLVGGNETYVITVTNQGSAAGTNIRIGCELPTGMSYVSSEGVTPATATGASVALGALRSLAPGEETSWRITVRAEEAGDKRFKVTMNSDQLTTPVEETEATYLYE